MLPAVADRILSSLESALRAQHNVLTLDPAVAAQFRTQVELVLADVVRSIGASEGAARADAESLKIDFHQSGLIGQVRAAQNIHPSDSLTAANVLFDVALPELISEFGDGSTSMFIRISRALHESIMSQVIPASVGYVDALLAKLSMAQSEERMRVSRELHDRVAHGIAASLQRIDLGRAVDTTHSEATGSLLSDAEAILRNALEDTRAIALELRQTVGDKLLEDAVQDYLDDMDVTRPQQTLEGTGRSRRLPAGVGEEAFLIIREAIRNAFLHSDASRVKVRFDWAYDSVEISVSDNGVGFDSGHIKRNSIGLLSMRERAEVIGAELIVTTQLGAGVTILLRFANLGLMP
jgi:signal transduction histidine kinase